MTPQNARPRLVIYTVLTGAKEALGNPIADLAPDATSDLDIDFVCFTDNRDLRSPVWRFRYLDQLPLPAEKASRRPKALPHIYLPEWEFSLYIDNIVLFRRLPQQQDLASTRPYLFKLFRHQTRKNPGEEAAAILQVGYESFERIASQLDFYGQLMPVDSITPLSTCTVILRQHRRPELEHFGQTWWEQILNFGKRDQMSFDFAVKWSGAEIEYFAGEKSDNDLVKDPVNLSARVLANFDPTRYRWLHRDDAAAQLDPRQHYLQMGQFSGQDYSTRSELLEFICHRSDSSLGGRAAPRRNVAAALQSLLQPRRAVAHGRMLVISIQSDGPFAFSKTEADRASIALATFMAATGAGASKYQGARFDLSAEQLTSAALALEPDERGYDIVLVLGLPAAMLNQIYALATPVLTAATGLFCVLCTGPVPLEDVTRLERAFVLTHGACLSALEASWHDGTRAPLRNSLVSFEWGGGIPA